MTSPQIRHKPMTLIELTQEEAQKTIDKVHTALIVNHTPNTLPEDIFVKYFLPCFIGAVQNDKWLVSWISIAGTPSSEVLIVDTHTKQPLFKVPPVLYTKDILLKPSGVSLKTVAERGQMLSNTLQGSSQYLLDNFSSAADQISAKIVNATAEQWDYIFKRYNLASVNPDEVKPDTSSKQEDYFDF